MLTCKELKFNLLQHDIQTTSYCTHVINNAEYSTIGFHNARYSTKIEGLG